MTSVTSPPIVSVVIPARNEAGSLTRTVTTVLAAAARLNAPVEVLIVEGRSEDGTRALADDLSCRHPELRVLDNPARNTPAAFNTGIRHARAAVIAIVSAHSQVDTDFLRAGLARLTAGDAEIVGGPVDTEPSRDSVTAWLAAQVVSHPFGVGNSRFRVSRREAYVDAVPFALFARTVFERVGLFDETLIRNQDTEFFGRVRRAGLRVLLDPAVRSTYYARGTLTGLWRQGFGNAYWNVLVWRLNPAAFQWRHAVPGGFLLGLLAAAGATLWFPAAWWLLGLGLGAHLGVGLAAGVSLAWRHRRLLPLVLPPVFLSYHLCYGSGSVVGLAAFGFRRPQASPPPPLSPPSPDRPPASGVAA